MRTTCPNHFKRLLDISSQMVVGRWSLCLISSFLILSMRLTPRITRRHLISKVSNWRVSAWRNCPFKVNFNQWKLAKWGETRKLQLLEISWTIEGDKRGHYGQLSICFLQYHYIFLHKSWLLCFYCLTYHVADILDLSCSRHTWLIM